MDGWWDLALGDEVCEFGETFVEVKMGVCFCCFFEVVRFEFGKTRG